MGEPALHPEPLSVEEYFALEEKSEIRHEYWNGYLRAMAGSIRPHVTLSSQFSRFLNNALDGSPCEAGNSDMAVRLRADNGYVYPDVVVWCDDPESGDDDLRIVQNPIVIAEVLSSSTAVYDRTIKFEAYRRIASLTDYLMISQERVSVEHYERQDAGAWIFRHYVQRQEVIRLEKLKVEISVGELYKRLKVPEGLRLVPDVPVHGE